jgi:hypothetical protein
LMLVWRRKTVSIVRTDSTLEMQMKTETRKKRLRYGALALGTAVLLLPGCVEPDGFTIADADEDGWVSPPELERYMLEAMFAEADEDGNAKVTFAEWKVANPSADERKFTAPDRDGDKEISPDELKRHFAKYGRCRICSCRLIRTGTGI